MRHRLRTQILAVALLPTLLVGTVIGGYLLTTRIADLRDSQQQMGQIIADHLAPASEFAVLSGNIEVLTRLAERLVEDDNVSQVSIYNAHGERLASASAESEAATPPSWLIRLLPSVDEKLEFEAPILVGEDPAGDFEALFTESEELGSGVDQEQIGMVNVQLSPAPLVSRQLEVMFFGALMILIGLLIAFTFATRASLRIIHPINRVVTAFNRFRAGESDVQVPVRSRGETGLLEQGFNDLANEVQASRERMEAQIEQATSDLRETLEAVEIQNVELDLARKRAEESNRIKSEFLANISHEIRTPMNAIFGYTQLLGRTSISDTQREYIGTIQRSAESLLALLEDVLNLSRIEAGRIEVEKTAFNPDELIEEVLAIMAPGIYQKGLELVWNHQTPLPELVHGDAVKIRQVLSNLLSNASKFTEEGHVIVEAGIQGDAEGHSHLWISVRDTGIGIRAEDHSRLFQAFTQLDSSSARRHQGAGLGLVICEQLTRLMGGEIRVESQPGQGSCFSIRIPVEEDPQEETEPPSHGHVELISRDGELARGLAARLSNWGYSVINEEDVTEGDTTQALRVAIISRRELDRNSPLPMDCQMALASSIDRDELEQVASRLGVPCLPLVLSGRKLRETLEKLSPSGHRLEERESTDKQTESRLLEGLRIMIVEDNRINRQLIREFLDNSGAQVHTAIDGPSALELAAEWRPDLILMDIQLPGMDGLETSHHLRRKFPELADVPIIALTASASEGERKRCLAAGLENVLIKPVREEVLTESIARVCPLPQAHRLPSPDSPAPEPDRDTQVMGRNRDGELRPEIANMLLTDLPEQEQAAWSQFGMKQWQQLDEQIHSIKGTAAFCGFRTLRERCEKIRQALDGHSAREEDIRPLMERLSNDIREVIQEVREK